jgi:glycosyltransferase involved in cell wall biosynthesis
MATARPIVLGVLGESAALLEAEGAGIVIAPENPEALERAINRLMTDPAGADAMGRRGRRFVESEFDRDKLAAAMLDELRSVAATD